MADSKNPAEVAQALIKTLGEKIDELKKGIVIHDACNCASPKPSKMRGGPCQNCRKPIATGGAIAGDKNGKPYKDKPAETKKSEFTANEVAEALRKAYIEKIDALHATMAKMEKAEADGNAALLRKNIGSLPSETPSKEQISDGDADRDLKQAEKSAIKLPKAGKYAGDTEGSGGQVKKGKLSKVGLPMAGGPKPPALPKPAAPKMAGAPAPASGGPKGPPMPKPPAPPKMAGAPPAAKMELPQSPEKANGGKVVIGKMELPQSPEKANGGKVQIGKMELPQSPEKANGGKVEAAKKMELPQSPEKANGGKVTEGMAKGMMPMHPSPVFNIKPRLGGKDQASTHMAHAASQAAHAAGPVAPAPKAVKMPSPEEHASRAAGFNDFMPKLGKNEMASVHCPGCKKSMNDCSCAY